MIVGKRRILRRSAVTMLAMAISCFAAFHSSAAQGRGGGKGGGGGSGSSPWIEQFSDALIESRGWGIEQTGSPGSQFGVPGFGLASKSFDRSNVLFLAEGIVRLRLNITSDLRSSGAMLFTNQTYGYGTYEWCARMSSTSSTPTGAGTPLSGGVSAGFNYTRDSQTEIDFEFAHATDSSGNPGPWLYMVNWRNLVSTYTTRHNSESPGPYHTGFKVYKFVWTRNYIDYYVNGALLRTHVTNIPRASAHVMINHWGTNNANFGGLAQAGERFFYVDWFRFTPPDSDAVAVPCGPN
jgi:hypothetical protein